MRRPRSPRCSAPARPRSRLEETGAGRLAGHLRQRPRTNAPAGRHREGRALQADRQLKMELDFLKKELASLIEDRLRWIGPQHPHLSVQQQCELPVFTAVP
jgi:hypothetical protein